MACILQIEAEALALDVDCAFEEQAVGEANAHQTMTPMAPVVNLRLQNAHEKASGAPTVDQTKMPTTPSVNQEQASGGALQLQDGQEQVSGSENVDQTAAPFADLDLENGQGAMIGRELPFITPDVNDGGTGSRSLISPANQRRQAEQDAQPHGMFLVETPLQNMLILSIGVAHLDALLQTNRSRLVKLFLLAGILSSVLYLMCLTIANSRSNLRFVKPILFAMTIIATVVTIVVLEC